MSENEKDPREQYANWKAPETDSEQKEKEPNNIEFDPGGASPFLAESGKIIVEDLAKYSKDKIGIRFTEMKPSNPGFNSQLNPEFRDPDYRDEIALNSKYEDEAEMPGFLIHELAHSLEEKVHELAQQEKLETLPKETYADSGEPSVTEDYHDIYVDLITSYILEPDTLRARAQHPQVKNTVMAIEKFFNAEDFSALRNKLQETGEKHNIKPKNPQPFYYRVFDKIDRYLESSK